MNTLSMIVASLLLLLTLTFAVLLLAAIVFNLNAGRKFRRLLAARLDQLRLGKMLSATGIDINRYLHTQSVVDIQDQMERCSNCESTDTCDEQLAEGHVSVQDIDFCNNQRSLEEMSKHKA